MLADDVTIADVLPTLNDPDKYLRNVLENLTNCSREHRQLQVRIGITGYGVAPYYRVEPVARKEVPDGNAKSAAVFSGRSHQKTRSSQRTACWSKKAMSFAQVQVLLAGYRISTAEA